MNKPPRFRGKRVNNGEFVEGFLQGFVNSGKVACISTPDTLFGRGFHADPSTVEQIGGDLFEENKRLRELIEETLKRRDDTSPERPHYYLKNGYEALKETK